MRAVDDLLHEHCLRDGGYFVNHAATLVTDCQRACSALWQADELTGGAVTRAADTKRLVIVGRAGMGKTHLFCDVARRRLDGGRPTLLVLGQSFEATALLPQLAQMIQLDGSTEDVVAAFDAAAEASGHLGGQRRSSVAQRSRPSAINGRLSALLSPLSSRGPLHAGRPLRASQRRAERLPTRTKITSDRSGST